MEIYAVTGYKGIRGGWDVADPIIETTKVEALDSLDAASRVVKKFFGKPVKLFGKPRPEGAVGMFFEIVRPKIVIHVEDLNIKRPVERREGWHE